MKITFYEEITANRYFDSLTIQIFRANHPGTIPFIHITGPSPVLLFRWDVFILYINLYNSIFITSFIKLCTYYNFK